MNNQNKINNLQMNIFDICEEYYDCYIRVIYQPDKDEDIVEWDEFEPFEEIENSEVYQNCFVQVLKNSVTGEISVGWMKGDY